MHMCKHHLHHEFVVTSILKIVLKNTLIAQNYVNSKSDSETFQ